VTEAQRTSLKGRFPYSTYRPSKKEDTTRFMSRWLQRMRRRFVPSQSMPEVDLLDGSPHVHISPRLKPDALKGN